MFMTEPLWMCPHPELQNILCIYCFWPYSIFLMILVTFDCGCSIFSSFSLNIFNYLKVCMCVCVHMRTCTRLCMHVCMDAGAGRGIGFLRPAVTGSSKPPSVEAGIWILFLWKSNCSLNCWTSLSNSFVTLSIN